MTEQQSAWFRDLAAAGWHEDPDWQSEARQMMLPCGPVVWIAGKYQGKERSAWLVLSTGLVMIHGGRSEDDVMVHQFCADAVRVPELRGVAASQRELF